MEPPDDLAEILREIGRLDLRTRSELFDAIRANFCIWCGDKAPSCPCMRDE